MHDQLIHLAELSERPNLSIHVVPSGTGAHAGLGGAPNLVGRSGELGLLDR